jgi:hypothetical protein
MIHAHGNGHDGMPFFDEADWVGFVWKTGGMPRLSVKFRDLLYETIVEPGKTLVARSYRGIDSEGKRVPIEPRYERYSAEVLELPRGVSNMDPYDDMFYWSHYITSDASQWRLICDDVGEPDRKILFLWGGTGELWAKLRPHFEALQPWEEINALEFCSDNFYGSRKSGIRPEVYAGLGPVKLVGEVGLFAPQPCLLPGHAHDIHHD